MTRSQAAALIWLSVLVALALAGNGGLLWQALDSLERIEARP